MNWYSESDSAPLLSRDRMFETLSEEIEELLKQLTRVNAEMTAVSTGSAGSTVTHTLQRHRDILQDYNQEFRKTQTNLRSRREREELLQGGRNDSL